MTPQQPIPKLIMSIGAKSDSFRTYGYVIGRLTEGNRIYMKCTGTKAVYAATKSLALSRQKICDHSILRGDDICLRIIHQDGAEKDRVSKFVIAVDRVPANSLASSNTEEEVLRSGVKKRVRELGSSLLGALNDGTDVLGKSMGPVGVSIMMASFAYARWRLIKEGSDIVCFPEYRSEEVPRGKEFETRRVLNFMFRKVPFDPAADVDSSIGVLDVRRDKDSRPAKVTKELKTADETVDPDESLESQDHDEELDPEDQREQVH